MAAGAFKTTNFGQPIAQENKPLHSSPRSTDAAAKPSIAAYKRRKSERTIRSPKRPTSSWTTYFGRDFGVMVLMDSISQQVLSVDEVKYETNALYAAALTTLKEKGVEIQSIVCDGRKGLLQMFPEIPAQLCQFHQVKTVSRYLTRNPKTTAGKALWRLTLTLKDSRKAAFQSALQAWFEQHEGFLNERTVNEETGSSHYTHKMLRSAYLSLKRNLDYLFSFEAHPELGMCNTTNLLDGRFADLKRKLGCHHGMKRENKVRFIKDYFSDTGGD